MPSMALVFLVTFNAESLPIIGGGKIYAAQFAEAGGLKEGNEVRVAGVKVGKVTDISLDGAQVVTVKFRVKVDELGDQTTAAVKVKTMLGQKYLALEPRWDVQAARRADPGRSHHDARTTSTRRSPTSRRRSTTIDTEQIEESFTDARRRLPQHARVGAHDGHRVDRPVADDLEPRRRARRELFASTTQVSEHAPKDRNAEFDKIITDGSVAARRAGAADATRSRRCSTARLARRPAGRARGQGQREGAAAGPGQARRGVGASCRTTRTTSTRRSSGSGRTTGCWRRRWATGDWVDSYVCGLFGADKRPLLDNDVVRNCCTEAEGGGR